MGTSSQTHDRCPVDPKETPLVLASDMPRGLTIGEWNVQSLYNKIEQMRHVLDARGNNIHILGITETWLNNCHTNCQIAIQGYSIERHDRAEGIGGGVAVYIHNSVSYKLIWRMLNTCWLPHYTAHQMQQWHGIMTLTFSWTN